MRVFSFAKFATALDYLVCILAALNKNRMKDLDISNIESKPTVAKPKRDRIRIERKKYDAIVSERDKYKEWAEINGKAAHDLLRDYERVIVDLGREKAANEDKAKRLEEIAGVALQHKEELGRLKSENEELKQECDRRKQELDKMKKQRDAAGLNVNLQHAVIKSKAAEHAELDTIARTLRDQRDMARFLAALFFIAAFGFAVAVWIGRLVPAG